MGSPKCSARAPWSTDPSRTDTLPKTKGKQVTATALRPSTGSVKENDNSVSDLQRPTKTQRPAVHVKTERNCSPALGEKLSLGNPIFAPISSTFPGAEGLQATPPAMWPSITPVDKEQGYSPARLIRVLESNRRMIKECQRALRILQKREENCTPASASNSTAAVDRVEGEGTSIVGKERFKLSSADLVSDTHLRLKEKADKLQVSVSLFKNRRKAAGLGRWPGRRVRAEMKRAQAPAPA